METTSANTATNSEIEPKRLLDPFAEWHDHANQWDVSEVLSAREQDWNPDNTRKKTPQTGMQC